jgi:protein ImuB
MSLYVCAWAAEFPAQALLRLRTDWQTEPVVVLDGRAPEEWVCSLNRLAERSGAAVGMTRLEVESMNTPQRHGPVVGGPGNGLRLLKRSVESEAAARAVMLECVAKFSPRIEKVGGAGSGAKAPNHFGDSDVRAKARTLQNALHATGVSEADCWEAGGGTACAFVLDIAGTERLFGPPAQLAERLREELAAAGFRASIAVSANFDTARMKAPSMRRIVVIPEGAEAEALAKLPITALGLDEEHAATFALWGIGTLGELAALPEADLVARMGPKARAWLALARGEAEHVLEPGETVFALEEFCEFETPVEQIDSLLFVGARMIDCLVTRAAGRALALRSLAAEMGMEGGATHGCAIRPAVPTIDRKFLLKLLQLEIGAHPPQAAVVRLTLRAEAGAQSKVQLGLFAPQTPEPSRLDVTLARLRAMVGEERVGSPLLEDTHRADGFRMEGFVNPGPQMRGTGGTHTRSCTDVGSYPTQAELGWGTPRMALRRVRPARMVRVVLSPTLPTKKTDQVGAIPGLKIETWGTRPIAFSDGENRYEIAAAYGPWKTSGCWWTLEAWDAEEWDVLAVRAESLPSGAKAQIYLADHTARLKSCPDTSCLSDEIFLQSAKSCHDSQPSLSACTASSNSAMIACLLVHDRTRNVWRLEAFYD